jgi:4-hydroxy-tetrahydrodipicolinate synthase
MFNLTLKERVKIAKTVAASAQNTPVIASGHISDDIKAQIVELNEIAQTGISAVVIVTNRLARKQDNEDVWKKNLENLLQNIPRDMTLGFYECPYPYKRMLSTDLLRWCAKMGRFSFYKDTSCSVKIISERIGALKGTDFKIFNANAATLLDTLKAGASGFSGVMANFHPEFYVWLCRNWEKEPEKAQLLSSYLGIASLIESRDYPRCAKYSMQKMGLPLKLYCRANKNELHETIRTEVENIHRLDAHIKKSQL